MPPNHIELATNLAYAKGAYTAAIELGSERKRANLLLDTGSSTLVVLPHAYAEASDRKLTATPWAQQVTYGAGAWAGPVLGSEVSIGEGRHARHLPAAQFALVQAKAQDFRDCDGLLGLAYRGLDRAHDLTALLAERGVLPAVTWPWPFTIADPTELVAFKTQLRQQPAVNIRPLFSALEAEGVVADKFAMLIRRALVHVLDDSATLAQLAGDPLNRGVLVLGGGEECESLYEGAFHDVRIVHDLYYNANLIAVSVGDQPRIPAPPIDTDHLANYASNAIIDTGSSFLVLEASVYDAVLAAFAAHRPDLLALIEKFQARFRTEHGLPNTEIDHRHWPDLHFYLESPSGAETKLTCPAGHYWQRNALHAGESFFLLMHQLPHWPRQSILGLPLLCGHYCVFDRRAHGTGVVRMARASEA